MFALNNSAYRRLTHLESPCDIGMTCALRGEGTNFNNLGFGEFSARIPISTLGVHISSIFGLCAEKQVIGIDATPIVAGMANAKTIGNRAEVKLPRTAMSKHHFFGSMPPNPAITATVDQALPKPAFIKGARGNVVPETNG